MNPRLVVAVALLILTAGACTTDVDIGNGVRRRGDHLFFYDGPELAATLSTHETTRSLGENWLVLEVLLRATSGSGTVTIDRKSVSVMTPDGHRLPLITQAEYRAAYSEIHNHLRRAEFAAPSASTVNSDLRLCDRWFFADLGDGFAADELYLSSFELCSGPLVFAVPRGVQPGRWRLMIDLEESVVDIPFEVEAYR
jgi:hypothetical protein